MKTLVSLLKRDYGRVCSPFVERITSITVIA